MRAAAASTVRGMRMAAFSGLVLTLLCAGAWYGAKALEGNEARAAMESRWQDTLASGAPDTFIPGEVVGRIVIPRIELDVPLVEMADVDDRENLDLGPAHLAGSALPGRTGNCVIAGHRTTYTHPFFRLDSLREGDVVALIDLSRKCYEYKVVQVLIVEPDEVWVMDPTPENSVTLIACHPLYSARKRIVVKAVMEK
jgi:sortase A